MSGVRDTAKWPESLVTRVEAMSSCHYLLMAS
jgi:hypothetical protein